MSTRQQPVDVVLVGFGWTAAIMGHELTEAGLDVLALERGKFRDTVPDFATTHIQDELRYAVRHALFERPARETLTFRNSIDQTALPMRHLGSFLPAAGVGGAGVHWNGQTWRFLPTDFRIRSHTEERYGKGFIPEGHDHPGLGRHLRRARAPLRPLRVPLRHFRAGRQHRRDDPARRQPVRGAASARLSAAAAEAQLHDREVRGGGHATPASGRFPCPAANTSQAYKNPLGVQMGKCTYCGYCEWFACGNYSKASPQTTILPVLLAKKNFSYRTECDVTRVNLDASGKRATGVTYVDAAGNVFEQPAELVILCAYAQHNVHLLLLSGIGKPYDPKAGTGVVGRNYAYQITSSVDVFQDDIVNPFMGAGALGQAIDEFNGDNFDHGPEGFIGGGYIALWNTGGRPIIQQTAGARGHAQVGRRVEARPRRELPARRCRSRPTAAS